MGLSAYSIKKMGFELIPEGIQIEAYFKSLNLYQIRGISSGDEINFSPDKLKIITEDYSFSIGNSVNAVSNLLINDDFTDNEEKWKTDTKSSPPYLLVLVSIDKPETCTHGYWKHVDKFIITYDCFNKSKEILKNLESQKSAMLITSLSAILSSADHSVTLVPIAKEYFAETNLGKRLQDLNFKMSAVLSVDKKITESELLSKINKSLVIYKTLHPKIGHFYNLAVKEKDKLKQFIYYFIMIEIFTHSSFKELTNNLEYSTMYNIPDRVVKFGTEFFEEFQKNSKNLLQRFIWCSINKWKDIEDSDIDQFKSLKKIRDSIYHGEKIDEKAIPVHQVQSLALKLLRS
jgi:hypothetical protein